MVLKARRRPRGDRSASRVVHQALDDGGRREQSTGRPSASRAQTARPGPRRRRPAPHGARRHQVRDGVEPGAVRHGRGINDGVLRTPGPHRRSRSAPWSSGCGASASPPWGGRWCRWCRTARRCRPRRARWWARRHGSGAGFQQASAAGDSISICRSSPASGSGATSAVTKPQRACRVLHDPFGFARVQLGVDRHHHQAGPPGGAQHLQVARVVAHEQQHAVAGLQTRQRACARPARRCAQPIGRSVAKGSPCLRRWPGDRGDRRA
jgi:hypothetical protein